MLLNPSSVFPTLAPESHAAGLIDHLMIGVLIICAAIFVLVVFLVTFSTIRYRARPGVPPPSQKAASRRLEIAWTSGPLLLLLGVLSFTVPVMLHVAPLKLVGEKDPDILVIAHQWWWEVRYPKSGVVTANEIHIPVGKRLVVALESADVIHDFWVPALARKMDMIPGRTNRILLSAHKPGIYHGFCAEYCGAQHAHMRFLVFAQPAKVYDAWLKTQQQVAPPPASGSAARSGETLFMAKTCATCHTIANTSAQGVVGPDLTHVADRRTLLAAFINNTPKNLERWLLEPQKIKPGAHMPNLRLTRAEAAEITAYLETRR